MSDPMDEPFHADTGKVEQIEAVIHDFHLALDMREHAAGAGWAAMLKIQEILDMPWVQGAEQMRRREGK